MPAAQNVGQRRYEIRIGHVVFRSALVCSWYQACDFGQSISDRRRVPSCHAASARWFLTRGEKASACQADWASADWASKDKFSARRDIETVSRPAKVGMVSGREVLAYVL
jgi:hypothetical protein